MAKASEQNIFATPGQNAKQATTCSYNLVTAQEVHFPSPILRDLSGRLCDYLRLPPLGRGVWWQDHTPSSVVIVTDYANKY